MGRLHCYIVVGASKVVLPSASDRELVKSFTLPSEAKDVFHVPAVVATGGAWTKRKLVCLLNPRMEGVIAYNTYAFS